MPGQHLAAALGGDHVPERPAHQVKEAPGVAQRDRPIAGRGDDAGQGMVGEFGQRGAFRAAQTVHKGRAAAVGIY